MIAISIIKVLYARNIRKFICMLTMDNVTNFNVATLYVSTSHILTSPSVYSKVSVAVMKLFTALSVVVLVLFSVSSGSFTQHDNSLPFV